jgi:TPR repeat protein
MGIMVLTSAVRSDLRKAWKIYSSLGRQEAELFLGQRYGSANPFVIHEIGRMLINDGDPRGLADLENNAIGGFYPSYFTIGHAYLFGGTVQRDLNKAFEYFSFGASHGHLFSVLFLYRHNKEYSFRSRISNITKICFSMIRKALKNPYDIDLYIGPKP